MPPKREKKDQFTGDQASGMVLEYLINQNRPYSAADISMNLHNAVTKTTAVKVLKELHEDGEIECRVAGKQIVYHAKQDAEKSASEEELKALDTEYEALKEEIGVLKAQLKGLQAPTTSLNAAPTLEQLLPVLETTEAEVAELEETLRGLQEAGETPMDPKEMEKEKMQMQRVEKAYYLRRKQFKELWATLTEQYDGNKEDLWENLGLDEVD